LLYSDNADCMICFNLTSRLCSFHMYINHSPDFPNVFFRRIKVFCTPYRTKWIFDL